jgi:hypothetical protein
MTPERKPLHRSKTVWVGLATIIVSIASILADTWMLLGPDEQQVLLDYFGPEAFGVLGIIMIILRVVTTTTVSMRGDQ